MKRAPALPGTPVTIGRHDLPQDRPGLKTLLVHPLLRASLPFLAGGALLAGDVAAPMVTEEVPIGFLPIEWVNAAVRKTLSPQSRATLTSPAGPLRITDSPERVELAKQALLDLQQAPTLVTIELSFATLTQRTVQRLPVEPPVSDREIPVPNRYDAPRILAGPGTVTVIPAQPRDFSTRRVGPGDSVNLNPTGYRTRDPEVRLNETETVATPSRRFAVSTVLGRPVFATVLPQVANSAALRDYAQRLGAIANGEPAWPVARTELQILPELSGGALVVKVVPQIVLPPASAGQAPRHVPLAACAAGVLVARGAPSNTGLLPKADPEFYRLFFGMTQAADGTVTTLTVKATVQYIGSPPP